MRLDSSAPERTSPEEHFLSDLLSPAQQVQGLLLQPLESEKSQWLFPEVEWCFYSLHTQRINGCYKSSSCPEQRALLCSWCPRGHRAATHEWQRHGRVAQCRNAALVTAVGQATAPQGSFHSQCKQFNFLSASPAPEPSHRLLSKAWRAAPPPQSPCGSAIQPGCPQQGLG